MLLAILFYVKGPLVPFILVATLAGALMRRKT